MNYLSIKRLQEKENQFKQELAEITKELRIQQKVKVEWEALDKQVGLVFFYRTEWYKTTVKIVKDPMGIKQDFVECKSIDNKRVVNCSYQEILRGLRKNLIGAEFSQLSFLFKVVSIDQETDMVVCQGYTPVAGGDTLPEKAYPLKDVYRMVYS